MRKKLDKLMERLGYYRPVLPEGAKVTEADVKDLFSFYKQSETLIKYLRDLCEQDVRLYFQANNDMDRNKIRGAWSRTNYLISLIQKQNDTRNRN